MKEEDNNENVFKLVMENQDAKTLNAALGIDVERSKDLCIAIDETRLELMKERVEGLFLPKYFAEVCERRNITDDRERLFVYTRLVQNGQDPSQSAQKEAEALKELHEYLEKARSRKKGGGDEDQDSGPKTSL